MKKINILLIPLLTLTTLGTAATSLVSCNKDGVDREIDVDEQSAINSIKSTENGIECKVEAKSESKVVETVSIKIGDNPLSSNEFKFEKTTGKLVIFKETLNKYPGTITVTTTLVDKISMTAITSINYSGSKTNDTAVLKTENLKVTASFNDGQSRELNPDEYVLYHDGYDITSQVKGEGFLM